MITGINENICPKCQSLIKYRLCVDASINISSIIDINRFALLTFIISPIMGVQDSNLNFKLLSSLIIPNIEAEPSCL